MAMAAAKNDAATKSAAARIRDNQRRSRARRKEYVDSLQQKLQDYERRGVEATLDMQQAARSVAMENSKLRALLAKNGINTDEVDVFLRNYRGQDEMGESASGSAVLDAVVSPQQHEEHHQSQHRQHQQLSQHQQQHQQQHQPSGRMSHDPPSLAMQRKPVAILAAQPAHGAQYGNHNNHKDQMDARFTSSRDDKNCYASPMSGCSQIGTPRHHSSSSLTSPRSIMPAHPEAPHVDKLAVLASASVQQGCCEGKTQCTVPSTSGSEAPSPSTIGPSPSAMTPATSCLNTLSPPDQNSTSPMEMSCNTAAQIIAEMHGHGDRDGLLDSLGCNGRSECQVKNTVLFHILERDGNP